MGERVRRDRRLTEQEAEHYQEIRQKVDAELPDIRRRAQAAKPRILLKHVLKQLRDERLRQGLSLADVGARSGLDPSTLSRLEHDEDANVTLHALMLYAQAVDRVLLVHLEENAPV